MGKKITASPRKETYVLKSLIAKINSQYGDGTILVASDAKNLAIEFCPSGCHAFDFTTGGGIPLNRITQLVGAYSSCKTTLTLTTIREFQKKYTNGICGFIDVEFALDFAYAKSLGVDLGRLLVIRPDSGEQAVDLLMEMMKQDVPLLMAVDSIPAIIPLAEIETTIEQNFMGKHPMLINRMVKLCNARLKKSLTTEDLAPTIVILLNQIREKVGLVFGNPETTPGGRGKDFFSGLIVNLRGGEKQFIEQEHQGIKRKVNIGREFNAQVVKNKCGGRPFEETKFMYYTKATADHSFGSFNNAEALFDTGVFNDVITLNKNGRYEFKCAFGSVSRSKQSHFEADLKSSPKIAKALYRRIVRTLQGTTSPAGVPIPVQTNTDDEPTATLV